jgi:hypothetical protein
MTTPLDDNVSGYLKRPLRAEEEARADCEAARRTLGHLLGSMGRLSPRPTLADRQATRADAKRRRLCRYAHCLWRELDARELSGRDLHEEERMALMTALTAIRRLLA